MEHEKTKDGIPGRKAGLAEWLTRSGMMVFSVGFSLLVAETVLRIFFPIYTVGIKESYRYDPELGTRLKPGIHMFETTDYQQEVRTNALGTVNFEETFEPYSYLVFAIGDSFTQGSGVPSDATYPFQLSMALNLDGDGKYEPVYGVTNLGVEGYGTLQYLLSLERYAALIGEPDAVLYLGYDNDYEDDLLFEEGYRHRHLVEGSPYYGIFLKPMLVANDTQVGKRIKENVIRRSERADVKAQESATVAETDWPNIQKIVEYCHERDILLVVSWASYPSESYDWLRAKAQKEGLLFADWGPSVDSVLAVMPDLPTENNHSGEHHRTWVNRLIAEAYARRIRENLAP